MARKHDHQVPLAYQISTDNLSLLAQVEATILNPSEWPEEIRALVTQSDRVLPDKAPKAQKGAYRCIECLRLVRPRGGHKPGSTRRHKRRHFALYPGQRAADCVYGGGGGPAAPHIIAANSVETDIRRWASGAPSPAIHVRCPTHERTHVVELPIRPPEPATYEVWQNREPWGDSRRRPDVFLKITATQEVRIAAEVRNECALDEERATYLTEHAALWVELGAGTIIDKPGHWDVLRHKEGAFGELPCCKTAREREAEKQRLQAEKLARLAREAEIAAALEAANTVLAKALSETTRQRRRPELLAGAVHQCRSGSLLGRTDDVPHWASTPPCKAGVAFLNDIAKDDSIAWDDKHDLPTILHIGVESRSQGANVFESMARAEREGGARFRTTVECAWLVAGLLAPVQFGSMLRPAWARYLTRARRQLWRSSCDNTECPVCEVISTKNVG